jgi:hypothetical protein
MSAVRAFRVAAFGALLVTVGLGLDAAFWWLTYARVPRGHLVVMLSSAATLVLLHLRRGRPSVRLGNLAFTLNNVAALAALWATDTRLVGTHHWNPFDAQKLGALTVALLAPPSAWVGVVNIAAFTLIPVAEVLWWAPGLRAELPPATPFASVIYGCFALGVFGLQLRRVARTQHEAEHQAETAAAEHFARMVLALRDLANTPLQTIELTLGRVGQAGELGSEARARLRRACAKLIEIARLLEEVDTEVGARRGEELSPR